MIPFVVPRAMPGGVNVRAELTTNVSSEEGSGLETRRDRRLHVMREPVVTAEIGVWFRTPQAEAHCLLSDRTKNR